MRLRRGHCTIERILHDSKSAVSRKLRFQTIVDNASTCAGIINETHNQRNPCALRCDIIVCKLGLRHVRISVSSKLEYRPQSAVAFLFRTNLENTMNDERRTAERVPLPLEAKWAGQSGLHAARISDVSMGGCYIESLGQVSVGERIDFEVQLPTGKWMHLNGQVAFVHPNMGFGVRFRELSELESNLLEDIVNFGRLGK